MSRNMNVILRCVGLTLLMFLFVNVVGLVLEYLEAGSEEDFNISFDDGTFSLNGQPVGLQWQAWRTKVFLILTFLWLLSRAWRRGEFVEEN